MSVNCDKILHTKKYAITAPFGEIRNTGRTHLGTDCGTYGIHVPQYCPRNFSTVVNVVSKELIGNERGLYVDMQWKSIDRGLILQHLESTCVKKGQILTVNDWVGTTGDTGLDKNGHPVSTGIHAHIELYIISTGERIDYDAWDMEADMTKEETTILVQNILKGEGTKVSDWALESWNWAIQNGLTDGSCPRGFLEREQAMALFHRFYNEFIAK